MRTRGGHGRSGPRATLRAKGRVQSCTGQGPYSGPRAVFRKPSSSARLKLLPAERRERAGARSSCIRCAVYIYIAMLSLRVGSCFPLGVKRCRREGARANPICKYFAHCLFVHRRPLGAAFGPRAACACHVGVGASCRAESQRDSTRGGVRVYRHPHMHAIPLSFRGLSRCMPRDWLATRPQGIQRDRPNVYIVAYAATMAQEKQAL